MANILQRGRRDRQVRNEIWRFPPKARCELLVGIRELPDVDSLTVKKMEITQHARYTCTCKSTVIGPGSDDG